ncbi:ABC-type dipeptide/oligopeptide/nickel transport system, permease component [Frankia torreyi]|uniref:ABC-type dipeptide/oligopeptide/nickel transport system, permease component n=1 Tax=Frankia torreyi TaxID=1856 RepID=A0A0D8B720_9ACTN|nr:MULTISPECIES: ABC transporter permease [Frankia]KJE19976.1 ABC-type dipeptide/oligopeptide/nickel transport system, permease component [Frankia torreyi]KQC37670.1 peptide ABC transporter permease [Frankia sp. ACN1ag]
MPRYLAGRVAQALLVLWAAYTVTFIILNVLPSDPITLQLSAGGADVSQLTPAQLHDLKAHYGLDDPIVVQYFHHLWRALHFDFGMSLTQNVSVGSLITDKLPSTIALTAVAIGVVLVLGLGIAFLATYVQWRPARVLLARLPAVGVSLPQFFVGLLLIQVFSFSLTWLPATGTHGWRSLVLPAITLGLPPSAMLAQLLTRSLNDTWREPYITTARAKGLSRWTIQVRHALRNASLPALTLLGVLVGYTVVNAVVVETVFSRNGIGQLAQQAVLGQDVPVVQAIVLIAAALFVVVNLLVDLLYSLLDPRVARAGRAA